jgi:hypothetical protein
MTCAATSSTTWSAIMSDPAYPALLLLDAGVFGYSRSVRAGLTGTPVQRRQLRRVA